jgi:predicted transcriptional regulator
LSTKIEQLEWRRSKVVELRARGLSQTEIAAELQVSKASISLDTQYLRNQAKESIKEYVTEHYQSSTRYVLARWIPYSNMHLKYCREAHDNREKVAALELFKDTHLVKLELLSNATTIYHALEYIRSKQSQQHQRKNNEDTKDIATTAATAKQSVF